MSILLNTDLETLSPRGLQLHLARLGRGKFGPFLREAQRCLTVARAQIDAIDEPGEELDSWVKTHRLIQASIASANEALVEIAWLRGTAAYLN
ncbi:MAG: hypothetical protein WBP12_04835 [Candidatus Saccharimonas sp.]